MTIEQLTTDAAYRVDGHGGIAWHFIEPEIEQRWEYQCFYGEGDDPESDETFCVYEEEEVATGLVRMHMVGDDRVFAFDPDDVTELGDDEYCWECGQIGCGHSVGGEE